MMNITLNTVLKINTIVGAAYASNVILMPAKYLKDHGVGYTKNTTYVAHGLVGGVLGLTAMTYQAAFKGGDEMSAAYASVAAFAWWNITAARRVFIEKAKVIGPKINFCISGAMLGLFTYALAN
ncbi:unnamed protein product [Bathycoccus prasinos]|jgi:hypothetical protein|mmetsp:Transcript_6328/g.19855  ORF Transcript_6328/g.19855 Transcript_6328/m.19855 type:complete len:124 (-) Transcript_6328:1921-2292(-)